MLRLFKPPVKLGLFLINQEKQEQPQVSLQSCVEQRIHLTLTSIDFMNLLTDEILTTGEKIKLFYSFNLSELTLIRFSSKPSICRCLQHGGSF